MAFGLVGAGEMVQGGGETCIRVRVQGGFDVRQEFLQFSSGVGLVHVPTRQQRRGARWAPLLWLTGC